MALHILNKAHDATLTASILRMLSPGDRLLLIESACALALDAAFASRLPGNIALYVLDARLASDTTLSPGVTGINHDGFVRLVLESTPLVSWY